MELGDLLEVGVETTIKLKEDKEQTIEDKGTLRITSIGRKFMNVEWIGKSLLHKKYKQVVSIQDGYKIHNNLGKRMILSV